MAHDDSLLIDPSPARRSNGNGNTLRWGLPLVTAIVAGLVSYFSAIGAANERIAVVEARQASADVIRQTQFDEIQRSLARLEQNLRDLQQAVAPRNR